MKNAQENERCEMVNAKVILVILVLAGSALTALRGRSARNGEELSYRLVHRGERANIEKKEACLKKWPKNGFGLNVNKEVEVMKVKDDGSLERIPFHPHGDTIVSPLQKVRSTIVMDQDSNDVNSHELLVTMKDGTKLVVDLNTCTTLRVFMPSLRHSSEHLEKTHAVQVGEDGWTHQGCFKDNQYNGERVMRNIWDNVVMYTNDGMKREWCEKKCSGYKYYGVQFRRECFCGTKLRYRLTVGDEECRCSCPGAVFRDCGCAHRMLIYKNNDYKSQCLKFPRHYSTYKNGQDSIGFFQEGCEISANVWRWNGVSHNLIKAYVGHFVMDWNQFFITLSNGEGQWQGFARHSLSNDISMVFWVTGSWKGRTFHAYT